MAAPMQPTNIPQAWASGSGNYAAIPEETAEAGRASWKEGFPEECAQPVSQGGIPPHWLDFQGVLNALSAHIIFQQHGAQYAWAETLDYPAGAIVCGSDSKIYVASAASGPGIIGVGAKDPTASAGAAYWNTVTFGGPYLPLAGGTMTGNLTISKDGANIILQAPGITKGSALTSDIGLVLRMTDSTGNTSNDSSLGVFQTRVSQDGTIAVKLRAFEPTAGSSNAVELALVYPKTGDPYMQAPETDSQAGVNQTTRDRVATAGFVRDLLESLTVTVESNANGYYARMGQLQVCWGTAASGGSHLFPKAFVAPPAVVASMSGGGDPACVTSISTTAFSAVNANRNDYDGDSATTLYWIALGPWF